MQFPSNRSSREGYIYRMNEIAKKCEGVGIEERNRACFARCNQEKPCSSQFLSPRFKSGLFYLQDGLSSYLRAKTHLKDETVTERKIYVK